MRKVILILICGLNVLISNGQTYLNNRPSTLDSSVIVSADYYKTHFLWFTGYWNDKRNVFTTTPYIDSTFDTTITLGGGGMHLTVSPTGNVTIDSRKVDDWNNRIEEGLKIIDKAENKLTAPENDAKEWGHHFNLVTLPLLHDIKNEWDKYKVDNKEITNNDEHQNRSDLQNQNHVKEQQAQNSLVSNLNNWCEQTKQSYDNVIAFYTVHKKDKESDLTYPPPPAYSNKCISCDTSLDKLYGIQDSIYTEKFFQQENDMFRTCLGISKNLQIIGNPTDEAMVNKLVTAFHFDKEPSKAGPCSYLTSHDINEIERFLILRMYYKADKLFHDYRKNVETARPVIATLLKATRNAELMGFTVDENGNFNECAGLVSRVMYHYFDSLMLQQHDWSQLANIPFLFQMERQRQLLGAKESDFILKMFKLLNSFHLNIDMDIKVGKEGKGYQITHISGKTKITPEYDFVGDTCYRWVAIEDSPNSEGYPVKKTSKKIDCDIITNVIVAPNPPVYIGTKKYFTRLNDLKMDYCHPGNDTILLSAFIPEPNVEAGMWRIPMSPPQPWGTLQVEHMFQSISKMKELAASGKAKQQAGIMKQQGMELVNQIKSIQAQMGGKSGNMKLEDLHKIQDLAAKAMNLKNNENVAPVLSIAFPLQIQNMTATLQDKRYDAKEINPEESSVIIYGYYNIKVTYEKQ